MATNKNEEPLQRYRCSICSRCSMFAAGVFTRAAGVSRMRSIGWTIFDGEAQCPACVQAELIKAMQQSTAVLDAVGAARRAGAR